MTERSTAYLKNRKTGKVVEATLIDGVSRQDVEEAQGSWASLLEVSSSQAEHGHWDWSQKYQLVATAPLAYRMFGLECDSQIQGLMLVLTTGKFCRIESQKNKPLIYVDYLATAPWNSADVVEEPKFAGVGKVLVLAACQLSLEEGFAGRIGLHSLPQAETWYRETCGMTDLGPDRTYQNLHYFEMTPEQSSTFMKGVPNK